MSTSIKVAFATDHAGYSLKQAIMEACDDLNIDLIDFGVHCTDSVDYPDYAIKAIQSVRKGDAAFAILLCGSGIGVSIMANRYKEIRAVLCHTEFEAEYSRKHNNANVICFGAQVTSPAVVKKCLFAFFNAQFEAGRHQRRLDKINSYILNDKNA